MVLSIHHVFIYSPVRLYSIDNIDNSIDIDIDNIIKKSILLPAEKKHFFKTF